MRNRYVVCYDVSDGCRLRLVFRKLHGYGDPIQYSVFCCDLLEKEKFMMLDDLTQLINHREDRIMIINTGPVEGRGSEALEFLGRSIPPSESRTAIIL